MATVYGSVSRNTSKYSVYIDYSYSANDTTKLYTVTAALKLVVKTYKFSTTADHTLKLGIGGDVSSTVKTSMTYGNSSSSVTYTLMTKTKTFAYSTSARTVSLTASSTDISSGGYGPGVLSVSGSFTLPAKLFPSTISGITSEVEVNGENAVAVTIARASGAPTTYTHDLKFSMGGYTHTLTGVGTSAEFVIPKSWLAAIPLAVIGTATCTITTYNGTTVIGASSSKTFTVKVPADDVPVIAAVNVEDTGNHPFTGFVQHLSNLKIDVDAAASTGSEISKCIVDVGGDVYSGNTIELPAFRKSGEIVVNTVVTDARGMQVTDEKVITVYPYQYPALTAQVIRCDEDGAKNDGGTNLKISYMGSVAPVNDENTYSYEVYFKKRSEADYGEPVVMPTTGYNVDTSYILKNISADSSYDIRIALTDKIKTVYVDTVVSTAQPFINWNGTMRAMAIGKVAENPGLEVAWPTNFSDEVKVGGESIALLAYPVGAIYISVSAVNPAQLFGGTWEAFGMGRTLIGVDTSQTEFETVQKTGGSKTHKLTVAEMPTHTHVQNAHAHSVRYKGFAGLSASAGGWVVLRRNLSGDGYDGSNAAALSATATNQNTGGGGEHNNLQPYITVYMWQRVA